MSDVKLAFQKWSSGQVLEPEHLRAEEEAILGSIGVTAALRGLPAYGIARLDYKEASLEAEGSLSINKMTVVFPEGTLIDVPGNASVSSLNLKSAGKSRVAVYLHLLDAAHEANGLSPYEDDRPPLTRVIRKVELSLRPELDGSPETMRLAELEKGLDGKWKLSADFVPPLLQVGTTPFLRDLLAQQEDRVAAFQAELGAQLVIAFFSGERMAAARRCQYEAFRLRTVLAEHRGAIHRHPYFVFDALRAFYLELCILGEVEPDAEPLRYEHDDLAGCFAEVTRRIGAKTRTARSQSPSVQFLLSLTDNRFVATLGPDDQAALLAADEAYLVVQRPHATDKVSLEGVKLASFDRLESVYSLSLSGIPYSRATPASFQHSFGSNVDFHRIQQGDEWRHALAAGALAYYAVPAVEKLQTALYWRTR